MHRDHFDFFPPSDGARWSLGNIEMHTICKPSPPKFVTQITFGNFDSSSTSAMMFSGRTAIKSSASWLSTNSMCCQLMASWLYYSCSILKMCWTKNC